MDIKISQLEKKTLIEFSENIKGLRLFSQNHDFLLLKINSEKPFSPHTTLGLNPQYDVMCHTLFKFLIKKRTELQVLNPFKYPPYVLSSAAT